MRHLEFDMRLDCSCSAAFDLLGDVAALDRVTPGWFRLVPVGDGPYDLSVGSTIDYRLRWRGIPMRWRSVIRCWDRPRKITYEQAVGPFRLFRHEHLFLEEKESVRVVDRIWFEAAGGWAVHRWIVEPDLRRIFVYRQKAVHALQEQAV